MKVKNIIFSLLLGLVFAGGAGAYIWYNLLKDKTIISIDALIADVSMDVVIFGIFGLFGVIVILTTIYHIVVLILLREGMNGIGTYLDHTEQKHNNRRVGTVCWVVHYSYTDDQGIKHVKKHNVSKESDAIVYKQKGTFPIKYRGKLSVVVEK